MRDHSHDTDMELISVLGIAASIASIVELSTGCIKSLMDIRANYEITDMTVQVSIAQLSTLKAALTQISTWKCESFDLIPSNLETDLNVSLTSCKALIDGLNGHLVPLTLENQSALSVGKRIRFLLNGKEWSNLQSLLGHQISAIQLLLTTLQCRTQAEQLTLLRRPESRRVLSSIRENSSSLLWLRDDESIGTRRSTYTETSEFIDNSFAFDAEIFRSKVYMTAMKSHLKQAVRVSARRFKRQGSSGGTTSDTLDGGVISITRGEGILPVERRLQEYSAPTQLHASNESLPLSSLDWRSDAVAAQISPLALPVIPSVGPGKSMQKIGGETQNGNSQMPRFLGSRVISTTSSSRERFNAVLDLPGVSKKGTETQILLTGNAKKSALFLQRSMKFAYGHNYSKATKEAFRISIMRSMVQNMRELLSSVEKFGVPLDHNSELHAETILNTVVTSINESLPPDISTALAVLWKDPSVLDAFRHTWTSRDWDDPEYFSDNLQRISQSNYKPSVEDMSRASLMILDIPHVTVTKKFGGKRHDYRFIDVVRPEADGNEWVDATAEVSLVVQVGNMAAYDVPYDGAEPTNVLKQDLALLKRICSSRWLADTPVLVLLSSIRRGEREIQDSHSQLHTHTREVQSYIRDLFLRVERKYDMRLYIEYLNGNDLTDIGKVAIGIMDRILTERSIMMYGID